MKLKVLSPASESFRMVADLTEPNKREYCERYGFEFLAPVHYEPHPHMGWEKIRFIQEALVNAEWVLWMGSDTIFTNFEEDVSVFIDRFADMSVCFDENGLQSDVMFLKNSPHCRWLLDQVMSRKESQLAETSFMGASEQGAIVTILSGMKNYHNGLQVEYLRNTSFKISEMNRTMNKYPRDWEPGDMVFHVPGMPIEEKAALIKAKLAEVIR